MAGETQASIGYGSFFHISEDNGATWTEIAEVNTITPPNDKLDQIDATHMQSPNRTREFIPGLIDPGEAPFEMNFVPGSPSDLKISALKIAGTRVKCRVTFPNAVTWVFSAWVSGYEPAVPTDDKMTATVTWKVTGSTVSTPAAAPANTVLPAVSGLAKVGETLTAWEGTWTGSPSFAYQWKAGAANIAGATDKTYVPVAGDVGKAITVSVTGSNAAGTATAASVATADVVA
ncbi:phage tail tube protein [Mesorhizobium sp. SP-1A]|uniref:phage tail tube protein n=1 Tax=Mesorhizobium sp. SP-1A TaxID=3077840 RepID=UPI0028F6FC33|nr:phage tail tube protein [Mesorhizobium sp. SP-1A]